MFHSSPSVPTVSGADPAEPDDLLAQAQTCIFRHVTGCVARDFGIDTQALSSATRRAPRVALARQVAMYLLHVDFALSFEAVGRMFGRDRTTVSHACRVIEDGRDDIWLDCRLAALELACCGSVQQQRAGLRGAR